MFEHDVVIIPAYNPEEILITYIEELKNAGLRNIIIVDDGSVETAQPIFEKIKKLGITLLVHPVNQGKGRALKTAFRYLQEEQPTLTTIVTADADGQHSSEDVLNLLRRIREEQLAGVILGQRDFDADNVPRKNAFGNKLTSRVFKFLFGKLIVDTQTGLRGFNSAEIPWLLGLKGERFEYEMNMLMYAVQKGIPIHQIPIQTLYFGEKPATHYKPFRDSTRIAKQLLVGLILRDQLVEGPKVPMSGGL